MRFIEIFLVMLIVWSLGFIVLSQLDNDWECQQRLHKQADIIRY